MIGGGGGGGGAGSIFRKQQRRKRRSGARERAEGHLVLCSHEHFRTCEEPESFHAILKILGNTGISKFSVVQTNPDHCFASPLFL